MKTIKQMVYLKIKNYNYDRTSTNMQSSKQVLAYLNQFSAKSLHVMLYGRV